MDNLIPAIAFPLGLLVGSLVVGLWMRGKAASAIGQAKSEEVAERAALHERLRGLEAERAELHRTHEELKSQFQEVRNALDLSRDDRAQLSERASRVPILESQLEELSKQEKTHQQEVLRLSKSEAEKAQLLEVMSKQFAAAEQNVSEAKSSLDSLGVALQQSAERRATLESETSRIPVLESELTTTKQALTAASQQASDLREAVGRINAELKAESEALSKTREDLLAEKAQRELADARVRKLSVDVAELNTSLAAEKRQAAEKLAILLQAKDTLTDQFKSLASEILEEKSKRFTEQNQTNISQLLSPLKERMSEFKTKVEEIHIKDAEQQAALRTELGQLKDLNRQLTEEAHGLATALKGQAKKQGNWGELVLGNVLDRSGLREGMDFKREVSFNTDDGRKRPDVLVYLPQSKHLVIDAKVSLNAYTRYVNADDDLSRQQALQEHVSAVAARIQELSNRGYFDLPGLNSPEMVFMFIPIESAFVEALRADEGLFQKAIEQNVLVATPTTLLTSLNIVRQLWRFEEQNAHTAELADRAGKVYRKLVSFLSSMEAVGKQLDRAKESFSTAMGQLYSGKGNLINQAKEFERLGVFVQTSLPDDLVAKAALELEHAPLVVDDAAADTGG